MNFLKSFPPALMEKCSRLDKLSMYYETAVQLLPGSGYLEAFLEFYEIKNRELELIPAEGSFREALRELSGDDVWEPIARQTEALFGTPGLSGTPKVARPEPAFTSRPSLWPW